MLNDKPRSRDFVGARVIDPAIGLDAIRTIAVRKGMVAAILDRSGAEAESGVERVDCAGMTLCPGFIDPHVHVREPGDAHKETLATVLVAAAAGGFTAIAAMPNTRPALDTAERIRRLIEDAAKLGGPRCYAIGAVTVARAGTEIAPLRSMANAGAVAFSDDGAVTASLKALYHAARLLADLPQPLLSHCEHPDFADGLMYEGTISDKLGVRGVPAIAESAIAARDLLVAQATDKAWHLCHVSCAQTIDVLRWAQNVGVRATGEATPHHLQCTDELLDGFNACMRVNPPLRSARDASALREAVANGIITIFASDHAPHADWEKEPPLSQACVGFSGLETAVAATFDALGDLSPAHLIANFSTNVAKLLNVPGGSLAVGMPADLTGLFLNRPWTVDPAKFHSKGRVTPFAGRTFLVRPALTVVGGEIAYADHEGSKENVVAAIHGRDRAGRRRAL